MKLKVTKRAVEARIKRGLLEENKKLKKKGNQYIVVDLESGTVNKIFEDFIELATHTNCLESWEEIDDVGNAPDDDIVSLDDLVKVAIFSALEVIDKGIGTSNLFSKDEELLQNLINTFFKSFNKIPTSPQMNTPRKTTKKAK